MNEIQIIQSKIYEIRGRRVMLDADLAELYQVGTRVLNQAVKRNENRFPGDFMFRLTDEEWGVISSQFVMTSRAKRPKSALPLVFTEYGALMLSSVLRSEVAIETSIKITRAQLDAISEALAELQAKKPMLQKRRPIGFLQPKDDVE